MAQDWSTSHEQFTWQGSFWCDHQIPCQGYCTGKFLVRYQCTFSNTVKAIGVACSAGVFVLELAVVSSPPYWLEQSRWGGGGEKRKKTPARKGCENEKHPLISCASQIFRKWLIGQSKWTENYIIFPIKTNTREESTCYLQTSARIERVNYVVQKCLKRTLMIIVGFARVLSKWNLEI